MAEKKREEKVNETRKKNTPAKKKRRKMTPFLRLVCYVVIGASAFLLFEVFKEVYTTINLKQQLAEVQEKLQEVQDENSYLTSEQEKLKDPDYVANYARGNYLLSKDDEQIFYLPENSSK